jgi:hypothetical protein
MENIALLKAIPLIFAGVHVLLSEKNILIIPICGRAAIEPTRALLPSLTVPVLQTILNFLFEIA